MHVSCLLSPRCEPRKLLKSLPGLPLFRHQGLLKTPNRGRYLSTAVIMTVSSRLHVPGEDSTHVPSLPLAITSLPSEPLPFAVMAILLLAAVISIHHSTTRGKDNTHRFPLANPKRPWEFSPKRAQMEFQMNSTTMIDEAVKKYAGQPFRLWTLEYGQVLVLPERYVNEIKNDARFNFCKLIAKVGVVVSRVVFLCVLLADVTPTWLV